MIEIEKDDKTSARILKILKKDNKDMFECIEILGNLQKAFIEELKESFK